MKLRYGFVTNSSSTSFLIIYHGSDKKHRLYRALGVIPNVGGIPIAQHSTEEILQYVKDQIKDEEHYHVIEMEQERARQLEKDETNKRRREWLADLERWHKDRMDYHKKNCRMLEKHLNSGAVIWATEPIEDQGPDYHLFQKLDEYGTQDGITVLRFEEHR